MRLLVAIAALAVVGAAIAWFLRGRRASATDDWPPEAIARVESDRRARAAVRAENPALFQSVSSTLFRLDPMGINFGSNADEYDPEVGTIIPRLAHCRSEEDALVAIHEEFSRWFGVDSAGPRSRYAAAATEIWALWTREHARDGGSQ